MTADKISSKIIREIKRDLVAYDFALDNGLEDDADPCLFVSHCRLLVRLQDKSVSDLIERLKKANKDGGD